MKKTLMLSVFCLLFIPAVAFAADIDKSVALILRSDNPWPERVKLMDETAPTGDIKILDALVKVYYDSSLHFGCPSILYHAVSGLRYFPGNERALRVVRDGINHGEPEIRMISLEVLGIIGSRNDIEILKPFLASQVAFEAHYAGEAIKSIELRGQRSAL